MKYLLSFAFVLIFAINSQASTKVYRIAKCEDFGQLTVDLVVEGPNKTPVAIKYSSYAELMNDYTNEMMIYEKRAEATIESMEVNEGATSFKLSGVEHDRSDDKLNEFPLKAMNLIVDKNIYILRKTSGNNWMTIHPRCEYSNTSLFR